MTNDYFESGKVSMTPLLHREHPLSNENIARYKVFYSNNKFLKALDYLTKKTFRKMSPTIHKSWNEFKDKNNQLVNDFIKKYGKQ